MSEPLDPDVDIWQKTNGRLRPYVLNDAMGHINVPHWRVDLTGPPLPNGRLMGVLGAYPCATWEEAEEKAWFTAERFCEQVGVDFERFEWSSDHGPLLLQAN